MGLNRVPGGRGFFQKSCQMALITESPRIGSFFQGCSAMYVSGGPVKSEVRIQYFVPDEHKSGGAIVEVSGKVKKVLLDKRIMVFSTDMHISIVDIIDICILGHNQ